MRTSAMIAILGLLSSSLMAGQFESVNVSYKLNDRAMRNTILVPQYDGETQPPIRGVMQAARGPLTDFAYQNQVAMFRSLDEGRGFSKALLVAAAKASNRPEIEFAGAIVQGVSAKGREAAKWALANRERAIAVILDHSFCGGFGSPVLVPGVPMYFNATYQNLFQNIDRRKCHGKWCTAAFRGRNQPCTSVIDIVKEGGHGGRGTTTLTALWLEEAMNHRVPLNIPVGNAYALIDVDPRTCGGYVTMEFAMDGNRTYHTDVQVSVRSNGANWWTPGPRSAALYLDWTQQNGGQVIRDESAWIRIAPNFIAPKGDLKKVAVAFRMQKLGQVLAILKESPDIEPVLIKLLADRINREVDGNLALLGRLEAAGDVFGVQQNIKNSKAIYGGIPSYDEKLTYYTELFKKEEIAKELKAGKSFYYAIRRINTLNVSTKSKLRLLKSFAKRHEGSRYGQAAAQALAAITENPALKRPPQKYFLN